ncbi:hypothetical protein AHF37_08317 [Paragonimus kellicotti]|nr:hypothetical protein AHF37_08317 [Paragonimus kellicotti]
MTVLFIVMEMLEGLSLTELLNSMHEKKAYFEEHRIWRMFIQLVLALRYLHREKGIFHRDLSSNNIMVGEGDKQASGIMPNFSERRQYSDTGGLLLQSMDAQLVGWNTAERFARFKRSPVFGDVAVG